MRLLEVRQLVKRFGGLTATDHVDLDVRLGEIHAIIGPNGAGKTTLINQIAGELRPSGGSILIGGVDVTTQPAHRRAACGLGRSYQISSVFPEFTVLENVMLAVQGASAMNWPFWRSVTTDPRLTEPARAVLEVVGLQDMADRRASEVAHGVRRQIELGMTLAMRPKLLLLDEPMAGMSRLETGGIVDLLQRVKSQYGILLVEHDMAAVFALADRLTVLVYGRCIASGTPDEIRANKDVRAAYLGEEELAL